MSVEPRSDNRMFWFALAGCILVILLGIPRVRDAQLMAVLKELRVFQANFDPVELQQRITRDVSQRSGATFAKIADLTEGKGVFQVKAEQPKKALVRISSIDVSSLGKVLAMSRPDIQVEVSGPIIEQVAESLRWRMARSGGAKIYKIVDLEWFSGGTDSNSFNMERAIEPIRLKTIEARHAYQKAIRLREAAERGYEIRRKKKVSRGRLRKAKDRIYQSRLESLARRDAYIDVRDQYLAQVEQTRMFNKKKGEKGVNSTDPYGIVVAKVERKPGGKIHTFRFPVQIRTRLVRMNPLAARMFEVTAAAGLWSSLQDKSIQDAILLVQRQFSWHRRGNEVGKIVIGGPTVLQLLPLFLAVLLLLLAYRCRSIQDDSRARYNPFQPLDLNIPKIGFDSTILDCAVLILLPLIGCSLCVWSLARIETSAWIGVGTSMLTLGAAGFCCKEIIDLRELQRNVVRTTTPPPPPDGSATSIPPPPLEEDGG